MQVSIQVRRAIKTNGEAFMAKNNVVAVGAGKEEKGGKKTGRDAVMVFVKQKLPVDQLTADDLIPREVTEAGKAIPTDVIEVGEINALELGHKANHRPIVPGISCGHYSITAGTLGLIVRKNDVPYILSNNHVLANTNTANIGDAIYQSGPIDGGKEADTIAELSDFVEISFVSSNKVDCALARITLNTDNTPINPPVEDEPPADEPPTRGRRPKKEKKNRDYIERFFDWVESAVSSLMFWRKDEDVADQSVARIPVEHHTDPLAVDGVDFINQPLNMELQITKLLNNTDVGSFVQKSGRTTGYTTGEVLAVNTIVDVNYGDAGVARFDDQLLCSNMSAGGDSGSAVFDVNGDLVGLLFAGSTTVTILNKIQHVFNELGINEIA